ncbi:hypothetical protein [Bizionia algoritergicola]|uniref:Uncharacterized protein n=1 Tax=Bizionia algoritergicola TaxID=291187 RepID=A0A5D0QYF6_9FLAO|nr:hypothetical protein [Bizionia algoritergicola]OBX22183.1 hypothetical protein BAA08_09575 [Bizionia sp. APA-3]TYB73244.1 hypothetical protein ES675_06160 [Bizionia algoritergicola]
MYVNKTAVDATATANGGAIFNTYAFRSSTEFDQSFARGKNFSNGIPILKEKLIASAIRPIRAF